jgi:hypothetical protein
LATALAVGMCSCWAGVSRLSKGSTPVVSLAWKRTTFKVIGQSINDVLDNREKSDYGGILYLNPRILSLDSLLSFRSESAFSDLNLMPDPNFDNFLF